MTRDGAARSTGRTLHWRLLKPASPRQAHNLTKQYAPKDAGWSSPVARQAHNLKVAGSNPAPATNFFTYLQLSSRLAFEAAFLRFSAKPIGQLGAFVALP